MTISNLTKTAESSLKRVENTVGKGEIARYEQFLLFPQCFQKACFPGASKGVIVWEWVKRVCSTSLLKTLWENEKLSNFSFSHSVSYQYSEISATFIKFEIVVCKLFWFGAV